MTAERRWRRLPVGLINSTLSGDSSLVPVHRPNRYNQLRSHRPSTHKLIQDSPSAAPRLDGGTAGLRQAGSEARRCGGVLPLNDRYKGLCF